MAERRYRVGWTAGMAILLGAAVSGCGGDDGPTGGGPLRFEVVYSAIGAGDAGFDEVTYSNADGSVVSEPIAGPVPGSDPTVLWTTSLRIPSRTPIRMGATGAIGAGGGSLEIRMDSEGTGIHAVARCQKASALECVLTIPPETLP